MLYVEFSEEARSAATADIDMLSIITPVWTREMRAAAGDCFVQVGPLYGELATTEDYLRAAHQAMSIGGACVYCAASLTTVRALADEGIPVIFHVGLIPSKATRTGGFKPAGKTAGQAVEVWNHVKALEETGAFGTELEVAPDRVAAEISKPTSLIMLGMGAGPHVDAQYLFAEHVLGYTRVHKPRHAKTYRDIASEYARRQDERVAAFSEFKADVASGIYPAPEHVVGIEDSESEEFLARI